MGSTPEPLPRWAFWFAFGPLMLIVPFVLYFVGAAGVEMSDRAGMEFETVWGGMAVLGSWWVVSLVLCRLIGDTRLTGCFVFFSLIFSINLFRSPGLSWMQVSVCSAIENGFLFGWLMLIGWIDRRRKKPVSTMWDADADRPLAPKGPL